MNNVKKNRTGLKLLAGKTRSDGPGARFTMNKTQQNQPIYSKVQPRCPGKKGQRAGKDCAGSNTNVGCKTCYGCNYSFDVSSVAFSGSYPSYGSFANVNPIVDSSSNAPCGWQFNAIVEGFSISTSDPSNSTVTISIEDDKCVGSFIGVYFYAPVGGSTGTYVGQYTLCNSTTASSSENNMTTPLQNKFIKTAKRMGAPYRNPIAGWRNSLDCCDVLGQATSGAAQQPTQTIYKDNYSGKKTNDGTIGCCATDCSNTIVHRTGIQGRTHKPIIRSGMQEKRPCCIDSNGKCNKKNDYSFSYRQYLNNSRCMSYERSKEKYVTPGMTKKNGGNAYRKSSCCDCDCGGDTGGLKCSNKAETKTIYKPSNKKFSKQGAVSSGSRLDRLKLDTIRASNSKCIKGQRCKIIPSKFIDAADYKVPNGKYDAGKQRFTGWMFNGHHSEIKGRVYNMVRYNQQPLGIPQLTANPPGKTCIKQCFPRTLNLGSNRSTAAGNRARIPGAKCPDGSVNPCNKCGNNTAAPCNNMPNQTGQGVPCC